MEEKCFFENDSVRITDSRFVVSGQTYAMRNVTSVKAQESRPDSLGGIIVIGLGIVMLTQTWGGLILVAIGALAIYRQKSTFKIILATSAGETTALTTQDKAVAQKVLAALNDSIVARR